MKISLSGIPVSQRGPHVEPYVNKRVTLRARLAHGKLVEYTGTIRGLAIEPMFDRLYVLMITSHSSHVYVIYIGHITKIQEIEQLDELTRDSRSPKQGEWV